MVLVTALTKAVRKHVKDTEVLGWITYEFDQILNANINDKTNSTSMTEILYPLLLHLSSFR